MHSEQVWKILPFYRLFWFYYKHREKNLLVPPHLELLCNLFLTETSGALQTPGILQVPAVLHISKYRSTFRYATKIFSPHVCSNKIHQLFCNWRVSNAAQISWKWQTHGFPLAELLMTNKSYGNQTGRLAHFPYSGSVVQHMAQPGFCYHLHLKYPLWQASCNVG